MYLYAQGAKKSKEKKRKKRKKIIIPNKRCLPATTKGGAWGLLEIFLKLLLYLPPPTGPRPVGEKTPTDIRRLWYYLFTKRPVFPVFRLFHHENEVILKFSLNSKRMGIKFATHTRFLRKYLA